MSDVFCSETEATAAIAKYVATVIHQRSDQPSRLNGSERCIVLQNWRMRRARALHRPGNAGSIKIRFHVDRGEYFVWYPWVLVSRCRRPGVAIRYRQRGCPRACGAGG